MKNKSIFPLLFFVMIFTITSCGPIVISSRPDYSPPPWFYPNRLEIVRYVYFPEYTIYYDLTARNYLYLENNVWIRVEILPLRYRNIDLRRSRYVRVKNYRGDNIRTYHRENYSRSPRSSRTTKTRGRRN